MEEQLIDKMHRLIASVNEKHNVSCYVNVQRHKDNPNFVYSVYVANGGLTPYIFFDTLDEALDYLERVSKSPNLFDGDPEYLRAKIASLREAKTCTEQELQRFEQALAAFEGAK